MFNRQLRKDIKYVQSLGWKKQKCKSFIGQLKVLSDDERKILIDKLRVTESQRLSRGQ